MLMMRTAKKLFKRLLTIRFISSRTVWRGASVSKGAIIKGDPRHILLDVGTIIEDGAVLSTRGEGRIKIGRECEVCRGAMILACRGDIEIGDRCSVNPYTILYGRGGLKIGNNVRIASQCTIVPANHIFASLDKPIVDQGIAGQGITIDEDVWIGSGVRILDGVRIGWGSVIGAGSVVTKDIAPLSVNAGVPSRIIKMRGSKETVKEMKK